MPFELFRVRGSTGYTSGNSEGAVGSSEHKMNWQQDESIVGSLTSLDIRADLRLKVEVRLRQLFDRSIRLGWSQYGMKLEFTSVSGEATYPAYHEASGILHLVALLAAILNDQIGLLIIDEPEISLHPQHQAYLLSEMEGVAGDPAEPGKKLIVIATHSASLLPLRKLDDLPKIAFFKSPNEPPTQIRSDADILKSTALGALVERLSVTHRMALFAEHVLLIEGPSDEIIATQLARRLCIQLLARNAQTLPVNGKGEFRDAAKLFRLLGKRVGVLADLDALSDGNELVCAFSNLPNASKIANQNGHERITDLDRTLRDALQKLIDHHNAAVTEAARTYRYWSTSSDSPEAVRRLTLARVLSEPDSFGSEAAIEAKSLCTRYEALLKCLAELGCFFLRRGAIENYYRSSGENKGSKPGLAAQEAASFDEMSPTELHREYADIIAAVQHIALPVHIDEDQLLRGKLAAALGAAFASMKTSTTALQLNAIAREAVGADAGLYKLTNCSDDALRIRVEMASPLFQRKSFPFEISQHENLNAVVRDKLPGR